MNFRLCMIPIEPEPGMSLIYLVSVRSCDTHRIFRWWFLSYPSKKLLLKALAKRTCALATRLGEPDCPEDQQEALADVQAVEDRVRAKWPKTPPTIYGYHFKMPRDSTIEVSVAAVHAFNAEEK